MLKIFAGIILLCFSFGGYLQFLVPFIGAVVIAYELNQMRRLDSSFNAAIAMAAAAAAYEMVSTVLSLLPIYKTGNFSSYLFTGKIILSSLLLLTLYIAFKKAFGRRVFGIFGLIAMNVGSAAVVLLTPVLNLGYDVITKAMAVLVYAFVLGYIGSDMRMIYLSQDA